MASPAGTQAVGRAARLLTEILDAPRGATFSELSSRTGLAKSTTSRLLLALEQAQLVRKEHGAFRAGDLFDRYAWRSGGHGGLGRLAGPVLERLAAVTGETVNLGVARAGAVEQIAQVDSAHLLGTTNWVGRRVPLHASALGKVLLAYGATTLPAAGTGAGVGALEPCTARTITSAEALARELDEVRRRGFATTDEELEDGLVAVASPVFEGAGSVIAALSVSAPVSRLSGRDVTVAASACARASSELSALLGHRPQREGAA